MSGNNTAGQPATGTGPASSETDDNKDDAKEPATGSGTAPATGATPEATWTPPTREEWEATQKSIQNLEKAQKEANKEAERRRKELAEVERSKMTEDEAKDAELEELRAKAEEWQVSMAEAAIERQVTRLVPTLGIVDPEVVTRLLDWDNIEFVDGKPADGEVEREVKNLLQAKPYLAQKGGPAPATRTGSNAAEATSGSGPKPDMTSDELAAAEKAGMSPERWAAIRDASNKQGSTGVSLKDWQKARGGSN